MELINRYLQAVRWWLPRKGQDDILREMSEDLHSQIEDKRAALGRDLTETEVAEILKKHGNPFLVASRFRTDQDWIAAPWLQLYRFVMKVVLLWVLTPLLAIIYIPVVVTAKNPASALLNASGHVWLALVFAVGTVTVGFGALRWLKPDLWAMRDWDPLRLPPTRDPLRISRAGSVLEVWISLMFLSWWMDLPHIQIVNYAARANGQWTTPTLWLSLHGTFYWLSCLIVASGIAVSAVNFFRPVWTWTRMVLRAGIDGILAVFMATVLLLDWGDLARQWEVITSPRGMPAGQAATATVNLSIAFTVLIILIGSAATCISRLKAARVMGNRSELPGVLPTIAI